jgi:hypothetical protein
MDDLVLTYVGSNKVATFLSYALEGGQVHASATFSPEKEQ